MIRDVLGLQAPQTPDREATVPVRFPKAIPTSVEAERDNDARIVAFEPDGLDLAQLELIRPALPLAEFARSARSGGDRDDIVSVFGPTESALIAGSWVSYSIAEEHLGGGIQLTLNDSEGVLPGTSGSPVFDRYRRLMGLLRGGVGSSHGIRVMIPIDEIHRCFGRSAEIPTPSWLLQSSGYLLPTWSILDKLRRNGFCPAYRPREDEAERLSVGEHLINTEVALCKRWNPHYVPLLARDMRTSTDRNDSNMEIRLGRMELIRQVRAAVREVVSPVIGGDHADARLSQTNHRSRLVRNLTNRLIRSSAPIALLGDPGSGKTITLCRVGLELIARERRTQFPTLVIYARLGSFNPGPGANSESVWEFLGERVPDSLAYRLRDLAWAQRLVILFDGIDEMPRGFRDDSGRTVNVYGTYIFALSDFAKRATAYGARTLFSCRINDFTADFRHNQLVILAFRRNQILQYLRNHLRGQLPIRLENRDEPLSERVIAERIVKSQLSIDGTNPQSLYLLCVYLQDKQRWPESRAELLEHFFRYRHAIEAKDRDGFPDVDSCFPLCAKLAYWITQLDIGSDVPYDAAVRFLAADGGRDEDQVEELIDAGVRCGVLYVNTEDEPQKLRFEHHRYQEYFTALHLRDLERSGAQSMDWAPLFDSPRWQETLRILLSQGEQTAAVQQLHQILEQVAPRVRALASGQRMLGEPEHEEATGTAEEKPEQIAAADVSNDEKNALADAANAEKKPQTEKPHAEKPKAKKPDPLLKEDERLLAERVEFAASLVASARKPSGDLEKLAALSSALVRDLLEVGNPVTQMRMLRAFANLPDVDLAALRPARNSNFGFIAAQAMAVRAQARPGRSIGQATVAADLADDLASGALGPRMGAYWRIMRDDLHVRRWWLWFLAAFCEFAWLAIQAMIVIIVYQRARESELQRFAGTWVFSGLLLLTIGGFALMRKDRDIRRHLMLIIGCVAIALLILAELALRGEFLKFLAHLLFLIPLAVAIITVGAVASHALAVSCFSLASGLAWRDWPSARRVLQQEVADFAGPNLVGGAVAIIVCFVVYNLVPIFQFVKQYAWLVPWVMTVFGAIWAVAAAIAFCSFIWNEYCEIVKRRARWPIVALLWKLMIWIVTTGLPGALFVGGVLLVWFLLMNYVIAPLLNWIATWIGAAGNMIVVAIGWIIVASICCALLVITWKLLPRWSYAQFWRGEIETRDAWLLRLASGNANLQAQLLNSTIPAQLGMDANEFLKLLEQVEERKLLQPEVLETYWLRRIAVEDSARQNR